MEDSIARWIAYLLPDSAALNLNHYSGVFLKNFFDVAVLNDSALLCVSGQGKPF